MWVQGCSIRCRGCINPHLFSDRGGAWTAPDGIVAGARAAGDEGLTLLGGEPFDQAEALAELASLARRNGLGVICFTGFTMEEAGRKPGGAELMAQVDLLVDGPYVADRPETERALVGSSNQRFIHLTERYRGYDPQRTRNRIELRISSRGETDVAGFLTDDGLAELSNSTGAARVFRR